MTLSIDALTDRDIAKTIDHSLLRPELDDAFVEAGCRLAADVRRRVRLRPAGRRRRARGAILDGTDVAVGTTIGFPHGNHLTDDQGLRGRAGRSATARPSSTWSSRSARSSPAATPTSRRTSRPSSTSPTPRGAIVKVIFENAYLTDDEKIRACHLTEAAGGDFVKTSTGFAPTGATHDDLRADARQHLAAHPGQGGRRRPDARRAARGDGPRRDPGRGHGDRRRSSTTSGRARPARGAASAPARRRVEGGY